LDFHWVTGIEPPPSPITAAHYAAAGMPFFTLPSEPPSGIHGNFAHVKSIAELEGRKELREKGREKELQFRTVQVNCTAVPPFRSLDEMEKQIRAMQKRGGDKKVMGNTTTVVAGKTGWRKWLCQ
jgi:hypothetical protein